MFDRAGRAEGPYVILAVPLLVEGGLHKFVDSVIVVDVDVETQIQRVMERDNINRGAALAILSSQASREERLAVADHVLPNNGSIDELITAVATVHNEIMARRSNSPR